MKRYPNDRMLVLSCTHAPYHHKDTIAFLKAIKSEYDPDRVIHLGDEVDNHAMNFYKSDPNLLSAGYELKEACKFLKSLERVYPKMNIVQSNHGSMVHRRAIDAGIPQEFIRDLGEVYGVGEGWKWSLDLKLRHERTREQWYFTHHYGIDAIQIAVSLGMNACMGHWHSKLNINHHSTPNALLVGMQVGCLIDDQAYAFAYNKKQPKRPIIGCGMIIDGNPRTIRMKLNKSGRWDGRIG